MRTSFRVIRFAAIVFTVCFGSRVAGQTALQPTAELSRPLCRQIDELIESAINAGELAGAVVVAADMETIRFARAYGERQSRPQSISMTLDTVFDLASLTKPIATACAVMKLAEQSRLDLASPVAAYLPEFGVNGKSAVTVTDLLLHQGGLIADNPLADYRAGPEAAWKKICALELQHPPGESFVYSDVGFIVLGKLVERVSGQPLDQFVASEFFSPLGMNATGFNPGPELRARAAATEQRDERWLVGEVHDPRAHLLGGVAGHAGLFSTAADLVRFGQMLLGNGNLASTPVMHAETIVQMRTPHQVSRGMRALGWDNQSPYSINRGEGFSPAAFGHGGFTGTVFWIDPERNLVFIFLSNRVHPDGQGSVNRLAGSIATLVAAELPVGGDIEGTIDLAP